MIGYSVTGLLGYWVCGGPRVFPTTAGEPMPPGFGVGTAVPAAAPAGTGHFNAAADAEDVAVRMANVHFADVPGHIGGRERDVEARGDAGAVNGVHVIDED